MQKTLKRIHENPWYILATLFGEQTSTEIDRDLHIKNKRAWNSWALHKLSDVEKESLIQKHRIFEAEIASWSEFEHLFHERLEDALPQKLIEKLATDGGKFRIPDPNKEINFSDLKFERIFCIEDFYFPSDVSFNRAKFSLLFEASWSVFARSAAFNNVEFQKVCDFSDATFLSGAYFNNTVFEVDAHWIGTSFSSATAFSEANFRGPVNFQNTRFLGGANFTSARMESDVWFYSAQFQGGVSFWKASIGGRFTMIQAKFEGEESSQRPDFSDTVFEMPANFRLAEFRRFYPIFSGTLLHERSVFSAEDRYWPKDFPTDLIRSRETCSLLRNLAERQGFIEDAHFFFRKEMRLLSRIGGIFDRFPYLVYGAVSNFGYSISRPAYFLLLTYTLGVIFLWGGFFAMRVENPLRIAIALSFNNVFPFFGFSRIYIEAEFLKSMHVVAKIFSALQSVISLPFLFLFGLGLRTRFRMR